jgi:hypothetical protein
MKVVHIGLSLALLSACAKSPDNIQPKFASATPYRALACEQLNEERARVGSELTRIEALQRENANTDAAMMTVGIVLLWPALLGLAATTDRSETIAAMKGERDAMEIAAREKGCPPPGLIVTPVTPPANGTAPVVQANASTPQL